MIFLNSKLTTTHAPLKWRATYPTAPCALPVRLHPLTRTSARQLFLWSEKLPFAGYSIVKECFEASSYRPYGRQPRLSAPTSRLSTLRRSEPPSISFDSLPRQQVPAVACACVRT